jgi:hypothetical protein
LGFSHVVCCVHVLFIPKTLEKIVPQSVIMSLWRIIRLQKNISGFCFVLRLNRKDACFCPAWRKKMRQ